MTHWVNCRYMSDIATYDNLTFKQLCEVARYNKLHGYSYLRGKAAMVNFMYDNKVEIPDYVLNEIRNKVGRPLGGPKTIGGYYVYDINSNPISDQTYMD